MLAVNLFQLSVNWQEIRIYIVYVIHAPARGATDAGYNPMLAIGGFNPRTRKGCDNILPNLMIYKRLKVVFCEYLYLWRKKDTIFFD